MNNVKLITTKVTNKIKYYLFKFNTILLFQILATAVNNLTPLLFLLLSVKLAEKQLPCQSALSLLTRDQSTVDSVSILQISGHNHLIIVSLTWRKKRRSSILSYHCSHMISYLIPASCCSSVTGFHLWHADYR